MMTASGRTAEGSSELLEEFRLSVLEFPEDSPTDGVATTFALVVLRRLGGMLLAVPVDFFAPELVAAGLTASAEDQLGQSTTVVVPAGVMGHLEDALPPVPLEGEQMEVLLIDVSLEVGSQVRPFVEAEHDLESVHAFVPDNPLQVPMVQPLVDAAWSWVAGPGSGDRAAFYSATEEGDVVPETPVDTPAAKTRSRVKAPTGTLPEGPKKPCQTVASLSQSFSEISSVLPQLMQQMESLSHAENGKHGGSALARPANISLATATWRVSYSWISESLTGRAPEGGASASKYFDPYSSEVGLSHGFSRDVGQRASGRQESGREGGQFACPGGAGAVTCPFGSSGPDCKWRWSWRPGDILFDIFNEGSSWASTPPARVGQLSWNVLQSCREPDGPSNATSELIRCHSPGDAGPGHKCNSLRGALWWFRQMQRPRPDPMDDCHGDGPPSDRELRGSEG